MMMGTMAVMAVDEGVKLHLGNSDEAVELPSAYAARNVFVGCTGMQLTFWAAVSVTILPLLIVDYKGQHKYKLSG